MRLFILPSSVGRFLRLPERSSKHRHDSTKRHLRLAKSAQSMQRVCGRYVRGALPTSAESPASTPNLGSREGNGCRLQPELRSAGRAEPRRPSGDLPGDLRKSSRAWTSCPTAQESGERRAPFCTNAVHQRGDLVQERIAIRRRCHVRNRRCPVVDLVPNNRCAGKARSAA